MRVLQTSQSQPLFQAIEQNDLGTIHHWDGVLDDSNRHILHIAAGLGNVEALKALVSKGVPVDTTLHDGQTPLHAAATVGSVAACQCLLDLGADPNALGVHGANPQQKETYYTPLDIASANCHQILEAAGGRNLPQEQKADILKCLEMLDKNPEDQAGPVFDSLVKQLAVAGPWEPLKALLVGRDVSMMDWRGEGKTILHLGALHDNTSVLEGLFQHFKAEDLKVYFKTEDRQGRTPLELAFAKKQWPHLLVMLQKGGSFLPRTFDRRLVAFSRYALEHLGVEAIPLLKKVDPEHFAMGRLRGPQGQNMVQYFCANPKYKGLNKMISELIQSPHINPNHRDDHGMSTLDYMLVANAPLPFIRALIQQGADIHGRNDFGLSPLSMAIYYQRLGAIDLLRELGAKADRLVLGVRRSYEPDFDQPLKIWLEIEKLIVKSPLRRQSPPVPLMIERQEVHHPAPSSFEQFIGEAITWATLPRQSFSTFADRIGEAPKGLWSGRRLLENMVDDSRGFAEESGRNYQEYVSRQQEWLLKDPDLRDDQIFRIQQETYRQTMGRLLLRSKVQETLKREYPLAYFKFSKSMDAVGALALKTVQELEAATKPLSDDQFTSTFNRAKELVLDFYLWMQTSPHPLKDQQYLAGMVQKCAIHPEFNKNSADSLIPVMVKILEGFPLKPLKDRLAMMDLFLPEWELGGLQGYTLTTFHAALAIAEERGVPQSHENRN